MADEPSPPEPAVEMPTYEELVSLVNQLEARVKALEDLLAI